MEVDGEDGSKIVLKRDAKTLFGRGLTLSSDDRAVSRRHIFFEVKTSDDRTEEPRVLFEVAGRNPIWIRSGADGEITVFRRSEKGEMESGDSFCVSGKRPIWFNLKKVAEVEKGEMMDSLSLSENDEISGRAIDMEDLDVSDIDPVIEFGFLVIGHEFDCYSKQMIHDANKWEWFLEEPKKESDDDDDEFGKKHRRGTRKKRKKAEVDDDDDVWTGESEDNKAMIAKVHKHKVQRPKYSTRSKDRQKPQKDKGGSKTCVQKRTVISNDDKENEDDEEDEKDETLGGFIVGDEMDNEEQIDEDEEEEEFLEDDNDDVED